MVKTERPEWDDDGDGRPRVLVENPDFGVGFTAERVLEAEGYNVAVPFEIVSRRAKQEPGRDEGAGL